MGWAHLLPNENNLSVGRIGMYQDRKKKKSWVELVWGALAFVHPSTNQAQPCLASQIKEDWVHSGQYSPRHYSFLRGEKVMFLKRP